MCSSDLKSQSEYNDVLARKQPQNMNGQAIRQQITSNNNNLNMAVSTYDSLKRITTWHYHKTWHGQTTGVPPVQSPSQVGLDRAPGSHKELTCDE